MAMALLKIFGTKDHDTCDETSTHLKCFILGQKRLKICLQIYRRQKSKKCVYKNELSENHMDKISVTLNER